MDKIFETRATPVCGDYDVVVVGGGIAGISAALAAARSGSKTLLIEKQAVFGGLATAGHVVIYLPLCDGHGRRVIGGISQELLEASIRYSYGSLPEEWSEMPHHIQTDKRCRTVFNGPAFAMAIDELLREAGVALLLDTVFCDVVMDGNTCKAVLVENKSGRQAYRCRAVVDATGDADLFFRAGANCCQQKNILSYWAYCLSSSDANISRNASDPSGRLKLMALGNVNDPEKRELYLGTDANHVTEFLLQGRRQALKKLKENSELIFTSFPSMVQMRTTRRICGQYTLTERDIGKHFEDSIGCTGDWRKAGPVYEVPFRCLCSDKAKNIFAAGRIISSSGDAWEVTRVIPPAAVTGQAAGTAASLMNTNGVCDVAKLRKLLRESGVILHHTSL